MPEQTPRYRFRGSVKPSAEVKRPVAVHRAETTGASDAATKKTSATIDIFDVIDSYGGWWGISAAEVDAALKQVGDVDALYVRVNSPGGEATEGVAIANVLRACPATVHVTNYGLAASAASLIAVSGDTLSMAPGSLLMIHEAWNVIAGSADDMRAEANVLDKISDSYAAVYALKGGTSADWRALMHDETWFTPDDAVAVGLADKVGIEAAPGVVQDPTEDDDALPIEVNVDIEITPAARAAARFDLSMFTNLPAAVRAAHTPPAEPPEKHPTTEEAVTMTETELKALRERLGLGQDADEATVTAAVVAAALTAKPDDTPTDPVEALAKAHNMTAEQVTAALAKAGKTDDEPTVPDGKVLVSQTMLDELKAGAADGSAARKKQLETERDDAIAKAFSEGKISADRRDTWKAAWDKDPEGTKADLDSLGVRFPVAKTSGYAGSDGTDGDGVKPFTDDEAEALAALAGTTKEALLNG